MEFTDALLEKTGHVATVTLNNPEKVNAITTKMVRELREVLDIVRNDDDIRVMVLTGAGHGFCSGADTEMLMRLATQGGSAPRDGTRRERLEAPAWFGVQVAQVEKPTIAAVNGAAVGGGFSLALACDMRIMSDQAVIGFMSTKRYALVPEGGVSYLLPRIIGLARAAELLFTGDILDAAEAERIGLVNRVVPHDQVMSASMELAERIAANGPIGMEVTKHLLYLGLQATDIASHTEREGAAILAGLRTEDFREGATAYYREHRTPVFTGH